MTRPGRRSPWWRSASWTSTGTTRTAHARRLTTSRRSWRKNDRPHRRRDALVRPLLARRARLAAPQREGARGGEGDAARAPGELGSDDPAGQPHGGRAGEVPRALAPAARRRAGA